MCVCVCVCVCVHGMTLHAAICVVELVNNGVCGCARARARVCCITI